ncbi:hypothetical protein SAMN05216474_0979 [Lishizhenia tianjinensis]|uniref:ISXO2-like transposase domain-containing protein n=1 Tax=Lishizhenia tianjinensis TaxID=477690 RepID=A0A1I6YL69_9FLAO|nr:hypothetical protein [Lishizhenia tianjinensis]SFT51068.1 hypothetical protein SAMN05216474_0979 [Lishizhenia tianjinensis]
MNFEEFIRRFGTEKKCVQYLKKERERRGICCSNCKSNVTNWRSKHMYWRCKCGKKISLKSGTMLESTKLKYSIWFKAIFLMTHINKSYSCAELSRVLGIKRERTVWYLMMKIRTAMGKDLNAKDYFQYLYIYAANKDSEKNITGLKNQSISAICRSVKKGNDEISLIAPVELQVSVFAKENNLKQSGYRCLKILGVQEAIELKDPMSPVKSSVKNWMDTLLMNSNRILNGVHHGVSFLHIQKYMFEFSFNYNYRNKDKFRRLFECLLT